MTMDGTFVRQEQTAPIVLAQIAPPAMIAVHTPMMACAMMETVQTSQRLAVLMYVLQERIVQIVSSRE